MRYNLKNKYKAQLASEYLQKLISKGSDIELKEIKGKRSLNQNSLYWLWMTAIQIENGLDKNKCHLLCRAKFLLKDTLDIEKFIYPKVLTRIVELTQNFQWFDELSQLIDLISISTTELDTKEFTYYLENIRDYVLENMGIRLLTLEEKNFEDFYNEYKMYM